MSNSEPADAMSHLAELIAIKARGSTPGEASVSFDLTDILAADSQPAFRRFLEIALRLCNAGSAGLSLLRFNREGQAVIRWQAVSGALASHEGIESPRDFSPCGLCLDAAKTTILSEPERAFPSLRALPPLISEDLIVPLYDDTDAPIGTLWIAHHDAASHFGAADTRIAQQMALLLQRALQAFDAEKGGRISLALLASHALEQRAAAHDLSEQCSRREHAEASESKMRQILAFKDAEIQEAHHRVKNTIQVAASFLQLQARKSSSTAVSMALQEAYCRLQLLANVHELLYTGADTARKIPMPKLLQAVAETLERSFTEKSAQVRLCMDIEPIMLAANDAIPLALLANEAITNAYKHAFPGARTGEISVTLCRTAGQELVLQICDDGIGLSSLPDGSSSGLRLIQGFAAQLGGALAFAAAAGSTGTAIKLTVPGRAESARAAEPRVAASQD